MAAGGDEGEGSIEVLWAGISVERVCREGSHTRRASADEGKRLECHAISFGSH